MGFDALYLALFSPMGYEADFGFAFHDSNFYWADPDPSPDLQLSARPDSANGTVHVEANYSGPQDLAGWRARVELAPAGVSRWTGRTDGNWPWADLSLDGPHLEFDLPLPAWMATGDLWVTVDYYRHGSTVDWPDPTFQVENRTVVHFGGTLPEPVDASAGDGQDQPHADDPTGTNEPARIVDDPPWWLVFLLLAGAAVLLYRRGWHGGSEGEGPS